MLVIAFFDDIGDTIIINQRFILSFTCSLDYGIINFPILGIAKIFLLKKKIECKEVDLSNENYNYLIKSYFHSQSPP